MVEEKINFPKLFSDQHTYGMHSHGHTDTHTYTHHAYKHRIIIIINTHLNKTDENQKSNSFHI